MMLQATTEEELGEVVFYSCLFQKFLTRDENQNRIPKSLAVSCTYAAIPKSTIVSRKLHLRCRSKIQIPKSKLPNPNPKSKI